MKIAVINNLYFPFNRGGAEQVVQKMITEFMTAGHEVFLISTKPSKIAASPTDKLKIYYLESYFYNLNKIPFAFRFFWHLSNILSLRKYQKIKKILIDTKPNLVITHNLLGLGFLIPLAIRQLKIRHEHVLHDVQLLHPSGLILFGQEQKINSATAKIYQFLTRLLFASPFKVVSPSHWLLTEHTRRGFFPDSLKEVKLFNFPLPLGDQPTKNKNDDFSPKKFLFVGQIESHKGILWLMSIFKKLDDQSISLIIVGDGQKMAAAQEIAKNDRRLELRGRLNPEDIKKIMAISDYLIVPSLCYENSPTVIYEAHALNLPVIAAEIGGIPEICDSKDFLFAPGNEEDLKQKLQKVITQKK
ncbi:MAG: glycosyltransferase [Patescibacteria group bacterium]|jgi:glycosyltransferase involved in cell wall biosynthesis